MGRYLQRQKARDGAGLAAWITRTHGRGNQMQTYQPLRLALQERALQASGHLRFLEQAVAGSIRGRHLKHDQAPRGPGAARATGNAPLC
eukprot:9885195-Lingulodinium_polyedra.AAC.1